MHFFCAKANSCLFHQAGKKQDQNLSYKSSNNESAGGSLAKERGHVARFSRPSDQALDGLDRASPSYFTKKLSNFSEINLQSDLLSQVFLQKSPRTSMN
jgi:hypothetical protein